MKTTIRRFSARVNDVQLDGLADLEDHGEGFYIARVTDLTASGADILSVVDLGVLCDLEEMVVRKVHEQDDEEDT